MNYRRIRFALATFAILFACGLTPASEIVLTLGPGGAASLANPSLDTAVLLTSYSISRSGGGVELSPAWGSLQSQGLSFAVTSQTAELLSEATTSGGLLFEPGQSKPIGVPFRLTADVDGNGNIDLSDFGIWKQNRGQSLYGPSAGDLDYNGSVDDVDFEFFLTEMGNSAVYAFSAMTVVPEPSVGGLLGLWPIGLAAAGRRNRLPITVPSAR
jgi:hypothetical protein